MSEASADYVYATAGTGDTYRENRDAFERYRIVPRMLPRRCRAGPLGRALRHDAACARGGWRRSAYRPRPTRTANSSRPPVPRRHSACRWWISTASDTSMEEASAKAGGDGPRWFRGYWPSDEGVARSLVDRAKASGCGAIVVTADNYVPG